MKQYKVSLVMFYWADDEDHAIEQWHDDMGLMLDPNLVEEVVDV